MVESEQASGHAVQRSAGGYQEEERSCWFSLERGGSSWTLKDGQNLTRSGAGGRFSQLEH